MLIAVAGVGARCCADQHEDCSSTQCWPWLECVAYTGADEQPAETCEIPCAADADCPWEQRCVDVTPGPGLVCMECVGEGEATDDPARCCDVPIHVPWFPYVDPVDRTTLAMLSNMGVTPDVAMDSVWSGHPGWDGGVFSTLAATIPEEPPEDHEEENLVHLHTAVRDIMTEPRLGASTRPQAGDDFSPSGAEQATELLSRSLNQSLSIAGVEYQEIVDAASMLLPNAVSFATKGGGGGPFENVPIGIEIGLVKGIGDLQGSWAINVSVKTVAISFLGATEYADGRRDAIIRQYGVTTDPFTPFDVVTGRAHFAPALSTIGNTVFVQETGPHETGILQRDNVVACTDYEVDGLAEFQDRHLRCKVFLAGEVVPHGGKLEAFGPRVDGVGPDVRLSSSPRAVTVGDVIHLFYSLPSPHGDLVYVAFAGVEFEPVTYNAVLSGFEFDDYPDLPRRVVTHVKTGARTPFLPTKPDWGDDGKWPLFAASPYSNAHGGLGFIGFDTDSGSVVANLRGYSPVWPW